MTRKANAMPAGGGGGGWKKMNESMAANRAKRQANARVFGQDLMRGEHVVGERTSTPAGVTFGEIKNFDGAGREITGTSIFDPVLCELAYRWFCPPGGLVLDPFAGGSVRGIVAAKCGRRYIGVDLSARQCAANRVQADTIWCAGDEMPEWVVGDAADLERFEIAAADFVFSCPPYGDLEVYSDNPADLSTMAPVDFIAAYRTIIAAAIGKLKEDRFACFVVGDYRGKQGFRAGKQFASSRKLGKTHQNVLVFVKGDPRKATEACGPVEIDEALFETFGEEL